MHCSTYERHALIRGEILFCFWLSEQLIECAVSQQFILFMMPLNSSAGIQQKLHLYFQTMNTGQAEISIMEILRHFEYGLSPAALLLLVLYHVYLYRKMRDDPLSTSLGLARRTRTLWVQTIMEGKKDILAVQTLRNWTMAATFLASAAILIGLGIFNLALTADKQGELSLLIGPLASDHPGFWTGKLVLLGADFLFAFFSFTQAVRYFNHTGFMINLPCNTSTHIEIEDVADILERGGTHYMLGMRAYYMTIPLALWLFDPLWLITGTLLMIAGLYRLDRGV